jgi:hypothetical protein
VWWIKSPDLRDIKKAGIYLTYNGREIGRDITDSNTVNRISSAICGARMGWGLYDCKYGSWVVISDSRGRAAIILIYDTGDGEPTYYYTGAFLDRTFQSHDLSRIINNR